MSEEKLHRDFDQLLSGFLSGELSPDELSWFQEELRKDSAKKKLLDEYRLIWDAATPDHSYDLDAEWSLLKKKLPGFETGSRPSLLFYTYRIAAVLVVGLILAFSWIYVSRYMGMERVLAEDAPVEMMLEDGTRVIVNRHSRLSYTKSFNSEERKVSLSGEAWFEVARDTTMPFVIDAGAALVQVLGTSFNVNAYKENPTVDITVESGLVAMSAKEDDKDLIVMMAGSGGSYNKSQKELKLIPAADPNSISWKTRELYFEESTLQEVSELVNKVYDVNIIIMNQELASCPITVTFNDQTLEAILNVLELTLDLKVTQTGDEIRLDGDGCVE
ncbi:MAG: FecR domain-containing protein [Bacteroidota bacterium]|nr:FecR domain-containing protein [Bacteroidota bacterium]